MWEIYDTNEFLGISLHAKQKFEIVKDLKNF